MAPINKSRTHGSQVVMRCSLQMVYQWTEELSIRTNCTNRKASLTDGGFFFYQWYHWWGEGFLTIGVCLCLLDMPCGETVSFSVGRKTKSGMAKLLVRTGKYWINNNAIIEFGFRRIWRILEISEKVRYFVRHGLTSSGNVYNWEKTLQFKQPR